MKTHTATLNRHPAAEAPDHRQTHFSSSRGVLLACAAVLLLNSCAGLSGRTLATEQEDKQARGFRYYDSSPYLLIYTDNKGGLNSEFKYLPDLTKKREVRPYQFLAKNEGTLTFEEGILTGAKTEGDGTAVPKAVISALETAAKTALAAADRSAGIERKATDGTIPAPAVYLFKIIYDPVQGWILKGAKGQTIKS